MAVPEHVNDVETWLETQPRDALSVFAIRSALRAVPYYVNLKRETFQESFRVPEPSVVILKDLYALATAISCVYWPSKTISLSILKQSKSLSLDAPWVNGVVDTVLATNAEDAAASALSAFATASGFNPLNECAPDIEFLERGGSARKLLEETLWHTDDIANFYLPASMLSNWLNLKEYLIKLEGQEWTVWTDWYEARLKGEPFIEEIEIGVSREFGSGAFGQGSYGGQKFGRVTFPVEDYKDPSIINPKIKAMIEEYWARQESLKQDVSAESFAIDDDGQVDRITSQTSPELTDTPAQRDWYESLRQSAVSLQDLGDNALGRAARPVNNLLDALPEELTEAKVARLWPAANRIRRLKSAHDKAIALGDEYHPNLLSTEVVEDIDQFVGVYNNLLVGDTNLALADQKALGPRDQSEIIEANNIAVEIINDAIDYDLLTDEAKAVLGEVEQENLELEKIKNESGDLSILEQLALDNNARINDNAIRALIIRVRDSKLYNNKGTIFATAVAGKILEYTMSKLPSLVNLIRPLFGL